MLGSVLLLALAAVRPLPDTADVRAGARASQCIFYYRLQVAFLPGGSAGCEADGYGLEFMRAHWVEVQELERKKQQKLDADLAHGREIAAAKARAPELDGPCTDMILDGGPGPDGGQALCDMAGFTQVWVGRRADHAARVERRAHEDELVIRVRWALIAGLIVVVLLIGGRWWRGSRR